MVVLLLFFFEGMGVGLNKLNTSRMRVATDIEKGVGREREGWKGGGGP